MSKPATINGRKTVTLIGTAQAQVGGVFIHKGPGSRCENCEYFKVCIKNVQPERVYEIVKVREKFLRCKLYEADMQVVEVVDAEILAAIPSKQTIVGIVITFQTPECKNESCENYELCFPTGLRDNDRCEVLEVIGSLQCSLGASLKRASLRLAPIS